jgi:hypothetical protein
MCSSLLLLAVARPAAAQGNLRKEMAEVAKDVKKLLVARSEDSVTLGTFTGPDHSSSGPSVAQTLREELQRVGVTVKAGARCEIKGSYGAVADRKSGRMAGRIRTRLVDQTGKVLAELDRAVFGDVTVPTLLGLTARLPTDGSSNEERVKARDAVLRQAVEKPRAFVDGGRVAAAARSPYAVEILVAAQSGGDYEARAARDDAGMAFVPIRRGEVYAVRLINDSDVEAAVNLSVDGLSMFAFSDLKDPESGLPRCSAVLVPAKGSALVKGWQRTAEASEEFVVTEYSKSAAAELKSTANVGTITACFSACWPRGSKPPAGEPDSASEDSRGGDATGRGAKIDTKFEEVQRLFGVVRDTISVRYTRPVPSK